MIAEFSNQNPLPAGDPPAKPNPVGGVVMPTNKFAVVGMYLILVGLTATLSTVYAIKRKKKT